VKYLAFCLLLSSLAVAQRDTIGQAIGIGGIAPGSTTSSIGNVTLENKTLSLETDLGIITVQNYPLEQQNFVGKTIIATRLDRPDGPESQLVFQNTTPFLIIGAKTSTGGKTIGKYRFSRQIDGLTAHLELGTRRVALPLGKNVMVRNGVVPWCVRLVAMHLPKPAALEADNPRFDWVALKVVREKNCQ
jgi:hypothetical protein